MLKNVIATYEVVMADEEKKVATHGPFVQNDGPNFDKSFNDPAVHPGLVSSGFGTSGQKPSGFGTSNLGDTGPATDFGRTGFGGSVYGSMEGYKGFGSSGSKSTKPKPAQKSIIDRQPIDFGGTRPAGSTPAPTGFGITPPAPAYTPYTPPALPQAPHQPFKFGISDRAPQPPMPGATVSSPLFGAPAFPPPPKTPHWSDPVTPFAPPKAPQQALRPFPPAPFSPAPMPAPLLAPTGTTARRPTPPGWRPMGLLDMSYVEEPKEKTPNRAVQHSAGTITTAPGELPDARSATQVPASQNAGYSHSSKHSARPFKRASTSIWDRFTEYVDNAWDATTEGIRFADEFATSLINAPRDVQLEFLIDFGKFLLVLIGPVDALKTIDKMINDPNERTLYNAANVMLALLPAVRAAKAGPKFYRFIEKEAKKLKAAKRRRGARRGKRPADRQKRRDSDRQMKASDGEHRPRSGDGAKNVSLLTRKPEIMDFVKGTLEAIAVETADQFYKNFTLAIQGQPGFHFNGGKLIVAGFTGGVSGTSSGFESDDAANIVIQFFIDVPNAALHTWGMPIMDSETPDLGDVTHATGRAAITRAILSLAKIVIFQSIMLMFDKRMKFSSSESARRVSRMIKIMVNKTVDDIGEVVVDRWFSNS
jgi:hypothetical protein